MTLSAARQWWDRCEDPLDWTRPGPARPGGWEIAAAGFAGSAVQEALSALAPLDGRRLLELASGHGHGTLALARCGADVVAVDLSPRRAAAARDELARRGVGIRVRTCAADATRLPFAAASFDALFARDVLMYADPRAIASECARVLRPGAPAVFVEALAGSPPARLWRRFDRNGHRPLARYLDLEALGELGEGLEPIAVRPHHLTSAFAFLVLVRLRSPRLFRALLAAGEPIDAWLLRRRALGRWAWRASALYRRRAEG